MAFLRPEFGLHLAVAHFIAMGFMLAAMTRPRTTETDVSAIWRTLVLLVPILYAMAIPDAILGNQAFKKRFNGKLVPMVSQARIKAVEAPAVPYLF